MGPNLTTALAGDASARARRVALVATAAAATVATALPAAAVPATATSALVWRDVVVTGSAAPEAAIAVAAAGGRVLASLPLVRGVAASLPAGTVLGPQWTVVPQRELQVAATPSTPTDESTTTLRQSLRLPENGNEGEGVTVAVVDTGIADVADLRGRVAKRVDVTGRGPGDGFGHGTFMAGLIAGSGAASDGTYRGVAPAATLIDVKVADADGSTDLITVLRGLQWVSQHASQVDVLNLSLSSYSPLPYQIDPLTQGLEALWRRGVTVVVPSGNDGADEGSVTSPGTDPVLLTAGGLDDAGTAARTDDVVAGWSGRGPSWQGDAKPDLLAPGARVVSLRAPGSAVDVANPQARIETDYFRGSGTSMATAVTSGVVAAALAVQPRLTPDSVKSLLTHTAYGAAGLTRAGGAGAGGLDAARVLAGAGTWRATRAEAQFDRDTAAISRDAKRWAAFEKAILAGDRAAAAAAWRALSADSRAWAGRTWAQLDPATREWAGRAWAGRAWAAGPDGTAAEWTGRSWAGRTWAGRAWADADWAGRAWAGRAWADADWAGRSWAGRSWADADWAGRSWAGRSWAGRSWADADWAGRSWAGRSWADADWAGRSWASDAWSSRAWTWLSEE